MKKTIYTILFVIALIISSCADVDIDRVNQKNSNERILMINAIMPSGNASTRVSINEIPGSLNLDPQWDAGDKINLFFVQGELKVKGEESMISNISNNGKQAAFTIVVPNEIDLNESFDVLGFCGTTGTGANIKDGKILVDLEPDRSQKLENLSVPVWFKTEIEKIKSNNSVDFDYLGTTEITHLQNNTTNEITIDALVLQPKSGVDDSGSWAYMPYISNENSAKLIHPFFNPLTGDVEEIAIRDIDNPENWYQYEPRNIKIPAGTAKAIASWYYPKKVNLPEMELMAQSDDFEDGYIVSANSKSAKDFPMRVGRAYHLYAVWDGAALTLTDDDYAVENLPSITMVTSKAIGETISLNIDVPEENKGDVWIDLNNNGIKDEGEKITEFRTNLEFDLGSQIINIYGEISIFSCVGNSLSNLEVSNCPHLEELYCYNNQLTSLTISNNLELMMLYCSYSRLTSLDISNNTKLKYLFCSDNRLTSLDVSNNPLLEDLYCYNNEITSLNVTQNTKLLNLNCSSNELISLDVSKNNKLKVLSCNNNQLIDLDVTQNQHLLSLSCSYNQLTELDISQIYFLQGLSCNNNKLESIDVSNNTELLYFYSNGNPLTCIQVNQEQLNNIPSNWQKDETSQYSLDCDGSSNDELPVITMTTSKSSGETIELMIEANTDDQKDVWVDLNNNGVKDLGEEITGFGWNQTNTLEINFQTINIYGKIKRFSCSYNNVTNIIIENNPFLSDLYCGNNELTEIDVSNNALLYDLDVRENSITSINLSNNSELVWLTISDNLLESIDLSSNYKLERLSLMRNPLQSLNLSNNHNLISLGVEQTSISTLDLSNNTKLKWLGCTYSKLTSLNVSHLKDLEHLSCYVNQLTTLDVSNNAKLNILYCQGNKFTDLDLSNNTELNSLWCSYNQLTELDLSNNQKLVTLHCTYNQFSDASLNSIFTQLPDITNTEVTQNQNWWVKELNIEGNPGAATSNTKIAVDKGWIVDVQGSGNDNGGGSGTRPDMPGEKW